MEYEDKAKGQSKGKIAATHQQSAELKTAKTKRKRGQRLPLESEVGFNTFADLATDCVFLFDSELNCVEINKAALQLFPRGTKEKDVAGKHLLDISLGLKETGRYNKCLEVLKTGIPFFEDIIIPGPKFAGVRLAASVFRANNGLGIAIKFATEIEKLEYVGKELSEAEERYRSLVESTNDVVYILDDKAVVIYVSPAIESILGYSASEIIGRPVYVYIYQQDWQLVMERFRLGSFPNIPGPFEFRVVTKSGDVRWVRNSPRTLIKQNRLMGYQGVLNDITDSKRALEDLERSERHFRALIENAQDAIVIVNPDITIRYESPSMARITGRKAEERIGKNPLDFCYPDDVVKVVEEFTPLLENRIPSVRMELRIQHKNGKLLDLELIGTNLIDDPAVGGIVLNLRDITKRKRAEEEVAHARAYLENSLQSIPDGVLLLDKEGKFSYVNPILLIWSGRKQEDFIGKTIDEISPPIMTTETTNIIAKRVKRRIQTGESIAGVEIQIIERNGRPMPVSYSAAAIKDEEGNILGEVVFIRDITERRRAEEVLRQSEEKLRGIFNSIGDAVIVSDLEGRIVDENGAALRMQGYSHKKEVIGRSGLELVAEKDRARVIEAISNALKLGYGPLGEFMFIDKNGRELCGEASAALLSDSSGNPEAFISVIRDITERKRAEEELIHLSNAVRMVNDSIVISDLQAKIVEVNEATLRMYGTKDKADLIGKNSYDLIVPEDREEAIAGAKQVLEGGYVQNQEYHIITKDGGTVLVEMNTAIMKDVEGKPTGFVAASRDITERRRVEEALQESEERFRSLVENAPYMIIIADREGKILFINYTTSGYSVEDTIGTSIYDYISTEYHDEVRRSIKGVFKSGEPTAHEITGAGPDGTTSWYSTRVGPIRHDGHIIAVTLMVSDVTEHRRAELQLRENEERLSAFMESATDGFTLWDSELNLVEINRVAMASFPSGTKKEDVMGKNLRDLVPGDRETGRIKQYLEVIKTGEPFSVEDVVSHPIFRSVNVDVRAFKVGDGLGIIARDVTERKKAEEELRESQEKLRILFDAMGVGITVVDLAGNIVDVNETVLRIKGFSREDVIGRFGLDFVAEKDRVRATDAMMDFLKGQEERTPTMEYALIKKDGSEIPCEANASLLRDSSGNVVGLISVERDITERKQSEERMRRSEQNLRNAQKMAHLGHWEWDISNNKVELSEEAQKIFGYKRDVVDFNEQVKIIHPEDMKRIRRKTEDTLMGKISEIEFRINHPSGDIRWILAKSDPMTDEHDNGKRVFGFVMDITERKKAEEDLQLYAERLRDMAARLSAAEEEERRHLSQELHDQVGQYLTALGINLSRASTELSDWLADPVRSILVDSQSIVERMSEVIRDVMADLRPPVIEDYGLVAAIRWYADRFANRTGINVTVQGEEPSPRLSTTHENALFRIAQEVLTNVAKHAQATKVSVNVAVKGEKLRLVITDDGIGFDTAEVDMAGGRRGWGLVIMSERAKSMGGSFDVESRPGHGTRVTVEVVP